MKPIQDGTCPLCNGSAQFTLVDAGHFKHYLCSKCVKFEISLPAEQMVLGRSSEEREKLSTMAAAAGDAKLLSIRRPIGDEAKDRPQLQFLAELIPRSKARK